MISYPIGEKKLLRDIERALPATRNRNGVLRKRGRDSWLFRARVEERKCKSVGRFADDAKEIWNELKPLFMKIQGDGNVKVKCAYCERLLPLTKNKLPAGDIDHFRPSSRYHLLAYNPRNYVLSCSECNQGFKRDMFSILGPFAATTTRAFELMQEQACLVNPLDPREPRLENLIGFDGLTVESIAPTGSFEDTRAREMIRLFYLGARDDLRKERATRICEIYLAKTMDPPNEVSRGVLLRAEDRFEPHHNCARSYLKLWVTDRNKALRIDEEANLLLSPDLD